MKFRNLNAEDIECRISTVSEKGCSLLLYKDARCDMKILDESVGSMNWKRSHEVINGNLFCNVSIYDNEKKEWITKQDVGTESYTEKEKGQASDSFKRACFNWGIGRELYTAPFIWVGAGEVNITKSTGQNGKYKYTTYDKFSVKTMTVKDGIITDISIMNDNTKRVCYQFHLSGKKDAEQKGDMMSDNIPEMDMERNSLMEELKGELIRTGYGWNAVMNTYHVESLDRLTKMQIKNCISKMKKLPDKAVS